MAAYGNSELSVPVAGIVGTVAFTPTAVAYGAADTIDVAKEVTFTFADGSAIPAGALIRLTAVSIKIGETGVPAGQTAFTAHFYNVTPPSALADNAAFTLAAGDLASYLGSLAIGTPADAGGALFSKTALTAGAADFKLASRSMFMQLVTDGGHTPAASARTITFYGQVL